jgi:hypothetical protein
MQADELAIALDQPEHSIANFDNLAFERLRNQFRQTSLLKEKPTFRSVHALNRTESEEIP